MKKIFLIVFAVGGLLWAKKHYLDAPEAVKVPTKEEELAAKIGALKVHSTRPPAGTAEAAATATTATVDDKAMSGLMATITNMLHKKEAAITPEAHAKERVDKFMAFWKEGGVSLNDSAQAAACMWSRGVPFIPSRDEIEDAANGFDRWRREKNLYRDIESYTVGEATRRQDSQRGDFTEFDVMINHAMYRVGVPDKANPIFWTF
jgi:hypothetical protein